ncbi:MAG: MerR family transcriptional regulator [Bacteroidota bacterium]
MKVKFKNEGESEKEIEIDTAKAFSPADNNIGNDSPESLMELDLKLFHHRIYFIGAVKEMTSKNLMDWKKNGLLPTYAVAEEQKWRRFNFLEVLWLLTIKELKQFGVPNSTIKKVRDELIFSEKKYLKAKEQYSVSNFLEDEYFQKLPEKEVADFAETVAYHSASSDFHNVVMEIIASKINSRIIIFENGDCFYYRGSMDCLENRILFDEAEKNDVKTCSIERMELESHISISLTKIICNQLLQDESNIDIAVKNHMTPAEIDLLNDLKKDNVTEIKVRLKNKKIELIEIKEELKLQAEARICELILTGGYQDFQIKTKRGNIVSFQRTTKHLK